MSIATDLETKMQLEEFSSQGPERAQFLVLNALVFQAAYMSAFKCTRCNIFKSDIKLSVDTYLN